MVGIGMLFASPASREPNIEDTLVVASHAGMEQYDLRVLSVLTTWVEIHHQRINADRLVRLLKVHSSTRVRCYWASVGAWLGKDRRLARLETLYEGRRINVLHSGTDFQVRRRGEDPRFCGTGLRVPSGVLRERAADVLPPEELAKQHTTYRFRVLIGPSYRADMWAALDRDPGLSVAQLARSTYGSFATAWRVRQDWTLLHST
jgi:hypothetical protein